MDHVYAFGIKCILYVQQNIGELDWFLESMHFFNNPYDVIEYIVPMACAVDSVFGAQILLSVAFGSWANTMLKWMLVEDRPYWWVRETTYYDNTTRPVLRQTDYTCETSPGNPSGHCAVAATVYLQSHKWISEIMEEMELSEYRDFYNSLPHKIIFFFVIMNSCLARMHAGAHFPHQCLFGAMLGSLLSPTVCHGITNSFLSGNMDPQTVKWRMLKHVLMAVVAGLIALFLGFCYVVLGVDIHWGTRLAFRWCESVETINVKSTPVFGVMQSVATLLGWALAVTPEITKYRYNAPHRNNVFFLVATALVMYFFYFIQEKIPSRRIPFYFTHFVLSILKPFVYFRVLPKLSVIFNIGTPDPVQDWQANDLVDYDHVEGVGAG